MKKSLLIIGIIIAISISCITTVQATTATASLKLSSTFVKPGDTFTATLSAMCEDGINCVLANISYDTDKLELVSGIGVSTNDGSQNWVNQKASKLNVEILDQRDEPEEGQTLPHIKNADVYILTFKVKDSIEIGSTADIKAENIKIDSDIKDAAEIDVESVSMKITVGESTAEPTNPTNSSTPNKQTLDESKDSTSSTIPSESQSKNGTSGALTGERQNGGSTSNTKTSISTSSTATSGKTDPTTATTILPKTGFIAVAGTSLAVLVVLAIVMYKKIKNLEEIK